MLDLTGITSGQTLDPASPLAVRGLTVTYGEKPALFSLDATFPKGAMSAIVGPNGAGKSTFLKAALGLIPRVSGEVTVFGRDVERARDRIAYVPQRASVDWDFPTTAVDVVLMGLYGQLGLWRRITAAQKALARACLDRVFGAHQTCAHHLVGADFGVHLGFDRGDIFLRQRDRVGEIEAQAILCDQRSALGDVLAQAAAQRGVDEVRRGVIGAHAVTALGIDLELDRIADRDFAIVDADVMRVQAP